MKYSKGNFILNLENNDGNYYFDYTFRHIRMDYNRDTEGCNSKSGNGGKLKIKIYSWDFLNCSPLTHATGVSEKTDREDNMQT